MGRSPQHNHRDAPSPPPPRAALWLAAGAVTWPLTMYLAGLRLSRFIVRGPSMEPALHDGDRLLVLRGPAPLLSLRGGALVVAQPRALGGREVVKRVDAVVRTPSGRRFALLGDNAPQSTDSRAFGPVTGAEISGRVLLRYWPDERRGRVR